MNKQEQAKIILEELNKKYSIPCYMEEYALSGIVAGLVQIERKGVKKDGGTQKYCNA